MNSNNSLLFAQITDMHIGESLNAIEAAHNLEWAVQEIGELEPQPVCILATGDLVSGGTEAQLAEYAGLVANCQVPIYALPANHDVWGEETTEPYERLVGPVRQSVDLPGLRIVLIDDVCQCRRGQWREYNLGWGAWLSPEKMAWVDEQLAAAPAAKIIAQHVPIVPIGDDYHDLWADSNASEVLELYQQHNIVALITGHWHRTSEWEVGGVRVITTGGLCGWQYNGIPPHQGFPIRPGYGLFAYDGERLHTFWRDGSYWTKPDPFPDPQVTLEWIGPAHTGGPRPQVRPVEVCANCMLTAKAFSRQQEITEVAWSLLQGQWEPMIRTYDGLWSEWEAEVNLQQLRAVGEQVLSVRATTASGGVAYDAVPVHFAHRDWAARRSGVAVSLGERLFAPFFPLD